MPQRPTRPSADRTRQKILKAAKKLFIKQGLAATSMQKIADTAEINQALLYHHFKNKQTLWVTVKATILSQIAPPPQLDPTEGLHATLEKMIKHRTQLYRKPEICRLMTWQLLEPQSAQLQGQNQHAPDQWLACLKTLQENGLIKANVNLEAMMLWIASSISGAFMSHPQWLASNAHIEQYQQMLIKATENYFTG